MPLIGMRESRRFEPPQAPLGQALSGSLSRRTRASRPAICRISAAPASQGNEGTGDRTATLIITRNQAGAPIGPGSMTDGVIACLAGRLSIDGLIRSHQQQRCRTRQRLAEP
jgi:hypothetical protein